MWPFGKKKPAPLPPAETREQILAKVDKAYKLYRALRAIKLDLAMHPGNALAHKPNMKKYESELREVLRGWPNGTERGIQRAHRIALALVQQPGDKHRQASLWAEMVRITSQKAEEWPTGVEIKA